MCSCYTSRGWLVSGDTRETLEIRIHKAGGVWHKDGMQFPARCDEKDALRRMIYLITVVVNDPPAPGISLCCRMRSSGMCMFVCFFVFFQAVICTHNVFSLFGLGEWRFLIAPSVMHSNRSWSTSGVGNRLCYGVVSHVRLWQALDNSCVCVIVYV